MKEDQKEVERAEGFIGGFKHGPGDCFKLNKDLDTYDIKFMDAVKASVQLVKTLNNKPGGTFLNGAKAMHLYEFL